MQPSGGPPALPSRSQRFERLAERRLDVIVVGGGVTGAGLGLDLASRGLAVCVLERGDWAQGTSSASSRLIHGGLRYLEQFEFGLVRESCLERGLMLHNAAGLVWPERFTFPVHRGDRLGMFKLAAGLGLYTLVSIPRSLGLPSMLSRGTVRARIPGVRSEGLRGGGSYLDGATDDSRLTLAVARTALGAGATMLSRVEATTIENGATGVEIRALDRETNTELTLRARTAVLAGGPLTGELRGRAGLEGAWVGPTRGTHILVPRERLATDGAVIFASPLDGRVMFLIPWPNATVIGTTDLDADPSLPVRATGAEVRYLLDSANGLVTGAELGGDDVLSSWAGLRPLVAMDESDPSARSREERIEREGSIYTIAGGKLTGYRAMAETLGARIARHLEAGIASRRSPTREVRLVGAAAEPVPRPAWSVAAPRVQEELSCAQRRRYAAFEPRVRVFCQQVEGGSEELDGETLLGEVDWSTAHEDCLSVEDFMLRRTDLAYGPRGTAERAGELVIERLRALFQWDARRMAMERGRLQALLETCHGWRGDEGA